MGVKEKSAIEYLSVDQAAAMLGVTVGRIRQMCRAEDFTGARKLNARAWIIPLEAAQKHVYPPGTIRPGAPRGGGR